jgi:endonuclease/exonuclease/phosphatase family metal-dependent hydrolase
VKTFTVVVAHIGNRGFAIQQQAVIESVRGRENVIAMGDFNSRPGEDAYTLATETLDDSWILASGGNVQDREVENRGRIDHIFVSRGTTVKDSRFLVGPQSDHPALMTEISW